MKEDKTLKYLKRDLTFSPSLNKNIFLFKSKIKLDDLKKYYSELFRKTKLSSIICPEPFPRTIQKLRSNHLLGRPLDLERELIWTSLLINEHRKEINQFLVYKVQFESQMLNGSLTDAKITINSIEENFGYSLWLIQNKLLLAQVLEGLDAQKELAKQMKETVEQRSLIRFLIHFFSVRAEEDISQNNFQFLLDEQFYSMKINSHLLTYLNFKLSIKNCYDIKYDDFSNILYYESNSSVIDIYETFIQVYMCLTSRKLHLENFLKPLMILKNDIDDYRLYSLNRAYGKYKRLHNIELNSQYLSILDLYTSGQYLDCINMCKLLLQSSPYEIVIAEIYAQCHIYINQSPNLDQSILINQLIEMFYQIMIKEELTYVSTINLLTIMTKYQGSSWINMLYAFIVRHISEEKIFIRGFSYNLYHLSTQLPSPFKSIVYEEECSSKYIKELKAIFPSSTTVTLFEWAKECNNTVENIPSYRIKKYNAINHYLKNEGIEASILFKELFLEETNVLVKNDAQCGYVNSLISVNKLAESCDILVDFYLEKKYLYLNLPVQKLINELSEPIDWPLSVSVPILFHLYSKYYGSDKEAYLKFAYENFLKKIGVNKPTELFAIIASFESRKIIYFLRYICIPEIMKHSISFSSSLELEEERIALCNILKDIDKENKHLYEEEIRDRTKNIVIQQGINRVEKSRIYVDINKVKHELDKLLLKENFKRFQSFKQESIEQEDSKILSNTLETIKEVSGNEDVLFNLHVFDIPVNEKDNLFHKMLVSVRDTFINSEYGLNVYLSTRIRHGNLSNQLRNLVEKENLVTIKSNETNQYKDNEFWINNLTTTLGTETTKKITTDLKKFTEKYDLLIEHIKTKMIQVDTTDLRENNVPQQNSAMFKYFITNLEQRNLQNKIDENTTYEEFLELLINWMWKKTDHNLEAIRDKFKKEIKEQFLTLFTNLSTSINISCDNSISPLNLYDAIAKSRTEVQSVIDNITSWFTRSEFSEHKDYDLEIAIKIAQNILTRSNLSIKSPLELNLLISHKINMLGSTLESFVDIFYILFDNAFKHCGLENEFPKIKLEITKNDIGFTIHFSNPVCGSKSIDELNESLVHIKSNYGNQDALLLLSKEGGTGFYKIWKILYKDLFIKHNLEFNYIEDTQNGENNILFSIGLNIFNEEVISADSIN